MPGLFFFLNISELFAKQLGMKSVHKQSPVELSLCHFREEAQRGGGNSAGAGTSPPSPSQRTNRASSPAWQQHQSITLSCRALL